MAGRKTGELNEKRLPAAKEKHMVDKTKKELEFESLENRVAPILVAAPAPSDPSDPSGGGTSAPEPSTLPDPKHDNWGQIKKVYVPN